VLKVRVVPLNIALCAPFGISRGALATAANVLVAVELGDGTVGYGEAAPFPAYNGETQAAALDALSRAAAWLPGRDASDWRILASESGAWGATECGSARCAVETALVDAVARRDGLPLWRVFGGVGTELRTDMTVTTGSPAEAADAARAIRQRGIRVIKAKVGAPGGTAGDLARISAILEAAPGSPLVLDGNAGMDRSRARELVAGLKGRGITPALLEQWLPKDDLEGMRLLGAESGWTVAADESVATAEDAERAASARAVSVFNVKLMKAGLLEALRVVDVARGAGYHVEGDRVSVSHISAGHGVSPRGLLL
jgi:L-alanine-DL-glutamate epimerase-like enolase superfamily enzyme